MTNPKVVFIGLILALFCTSRAQAQVTIDVSKITCRQFILYEVTKPEYIAIWIHGYYSGKRDSTLVEAEQLKANADSVEKYCRHHLEEMVMRAASTLLDRANLTNQNRATGDALFVPGRRQQSGVGTSQRQQDAQLGEQF